MNEMYERNLPPYQAHDLEAWKKGVEEKSRLLDCLWGELYGLINIAEINLDHPRTGAVSPRQVPLGKGRMIDLQRQFYKTYLTARYKVMFGSLY